MAYPGRSVRIKAWIPGAADKTKTVRILYRVRRGVLAFDDHDELYWNVTGNEWDVPIRYTEANVTLPSGVVAATVDATAYTGPHGAMGVDYQEQRAGERISFRTTRPLGPREGLTIAVGLPLGAVIRPSTLRRLWWFAEDNWPLTLPLVTLLVMGLVWSGWGRDPSANRSIVPEYEPPRGFTPAQGGALIAEGAQPRDVVATLVDVAVRGYVVVTRPDGDGDFLFRRVKPLAGDPAITPLERTVLQKVFGAELSLRERWLSELRRNYDYVFTPLRDAIDTAMVRDGYFAASPFWIRQGWGAAGVTLAVIGLGLVPGSLWDLGGVARLGWTLPGGLMASGLVILAFARVMPRRTRRGARALVKIRGFQEFLERAEKDRLERMPPDTLHRWLAWAIALGVTERWIHNWDGLDVDLPEWYDRRVPFTLDGYYDNLNTFGRRNVEALLTSRRSAADGWSGGSGLRDANRTGASSGSSGGGLGGGGGGTF